MSGASNDRDTVLEWVETPRGTVGNVQSEKDGVHIGRRG